MFGVPYGHCKPLDLDPGRVVFYKKGIIIDSLHYICEISYNSAGFYLSLFNIEYSDRNLSLFLKNGDKTENIMRSVNHDFDELAHAIRVKQGKIVIDVDLNCSMPYPSHVSSKK